MYINWVLSRFIFGLCVPTSRLMVFRVRRWSLTVASTPSLLFGVRRWNLTVASGLLFGLDFVDFFGGVIWLEVSTRGLFFRGDASSRALSITSLTSRAFSGERSAVYIFLAVAVSWHMAADTAAAASDVKTLCA